MKRFATLFFFATLLASTALAQNRQLFRVTVENVSEAHPVLKTGVFDTPEAASAAGPAMPGMAFTFSFTAPRGTYLSFATMFAQSNDWFYAPAGGIALYGPDGVPRTGTVTPEVYLWDAGTEVDERPGAGPNQAPRQSGPDTGPDEHGVVTRLVDGGTVDGYTYPDVADVIRVTLQYEGGQRFTVRLENTSGPGTLTTPSGADAPIPLSPGTWAVHTSGWAPFTEGTPADAGIEAIAEDGNAAVHAALLAPQAGLTVPLSPGVFAVHTPAAQLFAAGQPAGSGLERIAEDGSPAVLGPMLPGTPGVAASGVFDTVVGAAGAGPALPGRRFAFDVAAAPGERLSFATMFAQSNDWFYAFDESGLPLFDAAGHPVRGDVTSHVFLYDAGTEVDEELGVGPNQAPRQPAPDTGPAENDVVARVPGPVAGLSVRDVIRVTVTPLEEVTFTVRIENVSAPGTLTTPSGENAPIPLSPGVWALHTMHDPLFTAGQPDRGHGLERIAEDGNAAPLGAALSADGDLVASGVFDTPVGADGPGPATPGHAFEFTVHAVPGDRLSFATMFAQSNDLIYGPRGEGIALFDEAGNPLTGDVTGQVYLWDAGTEVNEQPGAGPNQAPRQSAPDTGPAENGAVVRIDDGTRGPAGFTYPPKGAVLRVTLQGGTAVAAEPGAAGVPEAFRLYANYPNPFNPQTTIRFDLAEPGRVRLTVYDVLGRRVTDLVDHVLAAGEHRAVWNGLDAAGQRVASGLYLYRLVLDGHRQASRTMVLLK